MGNGSYFRFDDDDKTGIYILSWCDARIIYHVGGQIKCAEVTRDSFPGLLLPSRDYK